MNIRNIFRMMGRRAVKLARSVSVRSKILGLSLGIILLFGITSIFTVRYSVREVMIEDLKARAISVGREAASRAVNPLLVDNLYQLNTLITETMDHSEDVRYIFIIDTTGKVRTHSFGTGFPPGLIEANANPILNQFNIVPLPTQEGQIWDVATPVLNGQLGTVRIGYTEAVVERAIRELTYKMLFAMAIVSLAGVAISLTLTRVLTRPILDLVHASESVSKGEYQLQINSASNDEIGRLVSAFNIMTKGLAKTEVIRRERECLRTEMIERIIQAQEDERKRIARDLHDQTSQYLTSLIVQLKLVETATDDQARRKNILELREQIRITLADVKRMAFDLHPEILSDLGLIPAIQWYADRSECMRSTFQKSGQNLCVEVEFDNRYDDLSPQQVVTIYRVVQEALTNVAKHSHARNAMVRISRDNGCLRLDIRDDGVGFSPVEGSRSRGRMGLFGMRERVELLGGDFSVEASLGAGTLIRAIIPLHEQECDSNVFPQVEEART